MILVKPYIWELNPVTQLPRLSALIVLLIICTWGAGAQTPAVHNINKYNGLSSNHVYCTLVDRMGYLWLGTTDGVYRYNGYTLRKYDYNDGLPNVDVWNLYEDKRGRIWLRSIAQQLGYIKNNNYRRVYKKTANRDLEIYPETLNERNDNKIFFLNNTTDLKQTYIFCVIENDTLKSRKIYESVYNKTMPIIIGDYICHTSDSLLLKYNLYKTLYSNSAYYGRPEKKILSNTNLSTQLVNKRLCNFNDKYIINYTPLGKTLNFLNVKSGASIDYDICTPLDNDKEQIIFGYVYKKSFYCIMRENIIIVDSSLNIKIVRDFNKVFQSQTISGYNSTFYSDSKNWGKILATSDNGLYVRYETNESLKKNPSELHGFYFVNNKNDTDGYWWNNETRQLATVNKGLVTEITSLPTIFGIKKIVQYDSLNEIILSQNNTFWFHRDKSITPFYQDIDTTISIDSIDYGYNTLHGSFLYNNDLFVTDNKDLYFLGISIMGSKKVTLDKENKRAYYSIYNDKRFRHIIFSYPFNTIICYSTDKVFIFNLDSKYRAEINQQQLGQLGFNAIEKIAVDKHGNLFIKDYNSLKVLNFQKGTIHHLLKTYNLNQAKIEIIDNNLFVAGNFGVLKAKIQSDGSINIINTFQNTKNVYYRYVNDVQFAKDHTLLKTDNGYFVYSYTDNDSNTTIDSYRIIADFEDTLVSFSGNDTLNIAQNLSVINLDVIKPTGTGNLRIEYSIKNATYQFSENQLILPALKPGSYNTVTIIASDDSWRSKPIKFTIYVQPEWWQTQTAKRVILVLSLLAFIGFLYLVIVMTRRFVNKANERRNQRRELELKSIYSQINPHFIFNSLSTAQYFVKKNQNKEAFEHINQFSDLLRAYIKSSRAKYITIAEEIENLENYLQLQLTRFEEKFEYTIEVDKSVNAGKVKIPSLLLQPLVENALNHGIFHSDKKGNLSIIFKIEEQDKDILICIVDDDGIGRQKSNELRGKIIRKADSYGTILIKELIDTFNKYEKINIEIEYLDKQAPMSGTTVVVRIRNYAQSQ